MNNHEQHAEKIDPNWRWTLTKTDDNEWCGKWVWDGTGQPPIPPSKPPQ